MSIRASIFLLLCVANAAATDLLDAIAVVESNYNYAAIGDGGRARGAWQFHRAAWEDVRAVYPLVGQYDGIRFNKSTATTQRRAAETYLRILRQRLAGAGVVHPTPAQLLCAWQMGYAGFRRLGFDASRAPGQVQRSIQKLHNTLNLCQPK